MACATAAWPKPEIDTRVKEAARILEIGADARPQAAAIVRRPAPARRDGPRHRAAAESVPVREPLSNLDAKLRIAMRVEIRKLQRRLNTTSIYVTHDQLEAMTLADILVVMNGGQVEQIGNPLEIYQKPATTFVASFIGAPPMNLMPLRRTKSVATCRHAARRSRHSGNPPRGFHDFERRRRRRRRARSHGRGDRARRRRRPSFTARASARSRVSPPTPANCRRAR